MEQELASGANADSCVPSSVPPLSFVPPDQEFDTPFLSSGSDNILLDGYQLMSSPEVIPCAITSNDQVPDTGPVLLSPSPASFVEDDQQNVEVESRHYLARLSLQYQRIADRYELCLSQLHDAVLEAEAIRLQNAQLRRANDELSRSLNLTSGKHNNRYEISTGHPPVLLLNDQFRRLSLADHPPDGESPTSVFGFHENRRGRRCCGIDGKPLMLPKSISVRSSGYLKIHPPGIGGSAPNRSNRLRSPTPVMQQKVFLGAWGSKKEGGEMEEALELEAYNQGMFKTELCNKWQESGDCPYGAQCQFAHGISELRPVIRHPRYKTELCRMVLSGDTCPYGHRCHFRHSLSPVDRLSLRRPT
ncbi:Zinc finger CCCH domain-containing protein 9 [Apostasia shenzhenica]|uniref:Zinc finger CCCH domain-containing protein 9 n=1 Tax=Apostasia shenzhenica TaxID=1088818 RepID=A0A2I0B9Y4_9ASPA|nr:Zinc finger CCCH domain-containing protein 9 [Apostasia shenzhenica]